VFETYPIEARRKPRAINARFDRCSERVSVRESSNEKGQHIMKAGYAIVIAAVVAVVAVLILRRRGNEVPVESAPARSTREQSTEDGSSVVQEWGEESFPASDAPQSW
jgi:hypothetical protein